MANEKVSLIRTKLTDKIKSFFVIFRSFTTAMQIFKPEVVFILGDVFDEGNWVNDKGD